MNNLSNAQLIKKFYKELLSDHKEHSRIELFAFAQARSGNKFSDGMLTGALRTLVTDTNEYICIRRGWYKKKLQEETQSETTSLIDSYTEILNDALKKSKSITSNPFKIMKMDYTDIEKMKDIEKCIDMIEQTLNRLRYDSIT